MLIPLTRKTFEELVPIVATAAQFAHNWGKLSDILRRILISVVGMFVIVLLKALFFKHGFDEILLISGIVIALYWLWGPILTASLKNLESRRYGYCGLWKGKILDLYVTEELVGTQETVDKRGELVVMENRERCLNLEVGDELGFLTALRVPLKKAYRAIAVDDEVELIVFSNRADLGRIAKTSDVYIPDHNLWVSDYPYVQRDNFLDVRKRIHTPLDIENTEEPESPRPLRSPHSAAPRSESLRSTSPRSEYLEDTRFAAPPKRKRIPRTEANQTASEARRLRESASDRASYPSSRREYRNRSARDRHYDR